MYIVSNATPYTKLHQCVIARDVFKSSNHTAEVLDLDLDSIKMSCTISHAPIGFVNLL